MPAKVLLPGSGRIAWNLTLHLLMPTFIPFQLYQAGSSRYVPAPGFWSFRFLVTETCISNQSLASLSTCVGEFVEQMHAGLLHKHVFLSHRCGSFPEVGRRSSPH